jgi:hypothetical protein
MRNNKLPSLLKKALTRAQNKITTQTQQYKQQRDKRKAIETEARQVEQLHREQSYKQEKLKLAMQKGKSRGKAEAQGTGGIGGIVKSFSAGSAKMLQNTDFDFTGTGHGGITNFMDQDPFAPKRSKPTAGAKRGRTTGGVNITIQGPGYTSKNKRRKKRSSGYSYNDNPMGLW